MTWRDPRQRGSRKPGRRLRPRQELQAPSPSLICSGSDADDHPRPDLRPARPHRRPARTRMTIHHQTTPELIRIISEAADELERRRVHGELKYPNLSGMHFESAGRIDWNEREACLAWANENEATVSEMRAWYRANRGEDL